MFNSLDNFFLIRTSFRFIESNKMSERNASARSVTGGDDFFLKYRDPALLNDTKKCVQDLFKRFDKDK